MHTPTAAFAWELWRRNSKRLMGIIGLVVGFALLYPKLCALAAFNPDNPDALDEFARKLVVVMKGGPTPIWIFQILYLVFLAAGPAAAMFLSLLGLLWMFTFIEFNPNKRDPTTFPGRIFTLPVSTSFLFFWLLLTGLAAIALLYGSWNYFVRLPHLNIFGAYDKCFGWMTLLALAQGIVWALAGWPVMRFLLLAVVFSSFLGNPTWLAALDSPFVLPALFLIGAVLGRVGLQKMRTGQWQGWTWNRPLPVILAPAPLRGPKRFASPPQAQLWFEWRRFARGMCFYVAAMTLVPVAVHVLARIAFRLGPLQNDTLRTMAILLLAVPLFIHFCSSISPGRMDASFVLTRPATVGQMTMARLKAAAISTAISWAMVFAALAALPLLGDFHFVEKSVSASPECRAVIVIGLIFLTWRIIAVNVWSARLAGVPFLALLVLWLGIVLFVLDERGVFPHLFRRLVPFIPTLLACLVAVKLLLAFLAFRVSLKRGLLGLPAVIAYLAIWALLVAAFLALVFIVPPPPREWTLPLSLGIVLVVPLARIGFGPIALARARHT